MAPFPPLLLIHTPEAPIQHGPGWGKLEVFCSEGFLGEAVKAATVWAFISPEKRRGGRKDREREQERRGGRTKGEFGHRRPC